MTKCTPEQCNQGHICTSDCQKHIDCPCLENHPMEGEEECTMDTKCKCDDCVKENVKMD